MEYKIEEIKTLLDLYFEGGTTLEEENRLREFFSRSIYIPEELEYARAMFGVFEEVAGSELPVVTTVPFEAGPRKSGRIRKFVEWSVSVAAVAIVAVFITVAVTENSKETIYCYLNGEPVTDYSAALACAENVLGVIDSSFGRTSEYLEPLEIFERSAAAVRMLSDMAGLLEGMAAPAPENEVVDSIN